MSHIEKQPKLDLRFFSFVCTPARETEARELLRKIPGVFLNPSKQPTLRQAFDNAGKINAIDGYEIYGCAPYEVSERITHTLSDQRISGYSLITQILFWRPDEIIDLGEK